MAQSHWLSVIYPPSACEVRITQDGSVEAFSAAQDIGTGTRTVMAQVVAEELGLEASQIGSYIGDTRYPVGPPSGGSRVTGSLTPAARNAAYGAARDLASRLAPVLGVRPDPAEQALDFFRTLLRRAYREPAGRLADLRAAGLRILPVTKAADEPSFPELSVRDRGGGADRLHAASGFHGPIASLAAAAADVGHVNFLLAAGNGRNR
jgi:CO/xanthine dehydrogenase Mo-binding subunit